jgi:mono/diheme cytochrome c family protein
MRWLLMMMLVPTLAYADPATDRLWRAKCASCHGADGKGQTEQGKKMGIADMSTVDWQGKFADAAIKTAISDGLKRDKNGMHQEMEAYKAKLRPDQLDGLLAYVRTLKK